MKEQLLKNSGELRWSEDERKNIELRIFSLRDDQIASLFYIVGISFSTDDIEDVIKEIRDNKREAIHLSTLLSEADSKENLLWWISYFEKHNRNVAKDEIH